MGVICTSEAKANVEIRTAAIENSERHVRKASHCGIMQP